ncbi:hypothetical protein [Teredinibacter haidensis]|uniref:hypothetical protein n=1 Tax=Teredinibacter haidensis TaxID=2731755 RepID=UPI000948B411|nr:hypothetical protein [Teredinibacter haidensis]
MKIFDIIKNIGIPLVSVLTAIMVAVLNNQVSNNDLNLRQRDQLLQQRLAEIDTQVKQSSEEREERESNQDFNLRIYEIVTQSLEQSDPKKQDAAKAFVVVMVDEPLRSSLLNVLKQGGVPEMQQKIGRILEAEEKFQTNVAMLPSKTREATASYKWADWDFDIFWCASSGQAAMDQASLIGAQLAAEGAKGRIRIRELPDSINARSGYQVTGYSIRANSEEKEVAQALGLLSEQALAKAGVNRTFQIRSSTQKTPWYVSAFVCPMG